MSLPYEYDGGEIHRGQSGLPHEHDGGREILQGSREMSLPNEREGRQMSLPHEDEGREIKGREISEHVGRGIEDSSMTEGREMYTCI